MSNPDYPLLAVPGYELYQLAHIATFIADRLARHRRAATRRDRPGRRAAARDVHAGRAALAAASGNPDAAAGPLPRPLDAATYRAAEGLLAGDGQRHAQVVSLAPVGRQSWAVIGVVPGIGRVGAEVADHDLAGALREHLLSQPAHELAAWAITRHPLRLGQDRWGTADEFGAVASLDPTSTQHRVVARHLRGISNELDVAIATRFAGIDLNAALATQLPAPATTPLPTSLGLEAGTESEPHAVPTAAGAFKIASGALAPDVTDDAKFANRAGPSAARSAAPTAITSPVTTSAVSEGVWLH